MFVASVSQCSFLYKCYFCSCRTKIRYSVVKIYKNINASVSPLTISLTVLIRGYYEQVEEYTNKFTNLNITVSYISAPHHTS